MVELKIPTVPKFLCFDLRTGNLVIGWIHLVLCVIIIITYFILLIFANSKSIEVENVELTVHEETHDEFTDTFDIIMKLIILVVTVFVTFITFWFITGIKACDPSKMKPYLILSAIYVILGCISAVVSLNFFVLVNAVIELYLFICAYSLYASFMADTGIQQDVMYKNPTAHGYTQAYEGDNYGDVDNESGNYQQQDDSYQDQHHQPYYNHPPQQGFNN